MSWSVERVVIGVRETVCGAIRGTLAWTLAPLLDWVYPPDSEPEIPMTDAAAYEEPTISTATLDALINEACSRFPDGAGDA